MTPTPITKNRLSFWAETPSPFAHYQTTSRLPNEADVVIVGSGFSGASVAYHLLEGNDSQKRNVILLEARQGCSGATGRNGGHLAPDYLSPDYAFEKLNFDAVYDLVHSNGLTEECYVHKDSHSNGWYIYETEAEFNEAKNKLSELSRNGIIEPNLRVVDDDTVHKELGFNSSWKVAGAIVAPTSPINPYKLVNWLLKRSVVNGLNLHTDTEVLGIDTTDGVSILQTSRGSIRTEKVVLATNGWTSSLTNVLKNNIYPVRGQVSRWRVSKADLNIELVDKKISIGIHDEYLAVVPDYEDPGKVSVIFGGLRRYEPKGEVGNDNDNDISPTISNALRNKAREIMSIESEPDEEWTGVMAFTDSGKPYVGELTKGVMVIAGFGGHGMPRIFMTGKAIVQLMERGEWPGWFPENYRMS